MERIRHILAPIDLSDHATQIIAAARQLAEPIDAEILLYHVVYDLESVYGVYAAEPRLESLQQDMRCRAAERLAELARRNAADARCKVLTEIAEGRPWTEIVAAALRHNADLIVLGAHDVHKTDAASRSLGSTAASVVRHAPCPVVVVPLE